MWVRETGLVGPSSVRVRNIAPRYSSGAPFSIFTSTNARTWPRNKYGLLNEKRTTAERNSARFVRQLFFFFFRQTSPWQREE